MTSKKVFCLVIVHLLSAAASQADPPTSVPSSAPSADGGSSEFIRTSCDVTLYPALCFTSLAGYASAVQRDPVQLARVSANLALARVQSVASHVAALSAASAAGADIRAAAALRDCSDALGDAADGARLSAAELRLLEAATGEEIAWHVSNAQTWMSAALTNEVTCDDGFDVVGPCGLKDDVRRRVWWAKQFTSNALALVAGLVAGRR